jgi:hypothetical protein
MIERGSDFSFVGLTGFMLDLRFMVRSEQKRHVCSTTSWIDGLNDQPSKKLAWPGPKMVARGRWKERVMAQKI